MQTESSRRPIQGSRYFVTPGRPGSRRILVWGLLATLISAALFTLQPTLLQPLDFKIYDLLLRHFPDNSVGTGPVIVDIDEKSLRRYGQWPWPRYLVAGLFDKITAMAPAVIGLDIIFAEPERTPAGRLLKGSGYGDPPDPAVDRPAGALCDNDRILAEALARGPFVLGNKFHFDRPDKESEPCVLHPVRVSLVQHAAAQKANTGIPESTGVLCNLAIFSQKAGASGFFNFSPDPDGMLRRLPLLIQHNGNVYASLALATVLKLEKTDTLFLEKAGNTLQSLNYQGISVPVDRHGQLLIKFRGPRRAYDYISAADILDDRVSSERLQGRITFVGTSADGLKDLRTTPFDPIFPGVEIHATVADNLLTGDFIAVPSWANALTLLLVVFLGVLLSLFVAFGGAASGFIGMLLFTAGTGVATQQVFFRMGLFAGPAFPMASVVCNYIFLTVLKYRLEEKRILSGMQELLLTQDITIESLANLAEYRDPETGGHIKRTRRYVKLLAEHLKQHDKYKHFFNDETIDLLYRSAPLHDIGKVGIRDHILLKPSRLSGKEFEVMKTHTIIGRDVIESAVYKLGKKSFLALAAEMAYSHQEKWDGTGYPQGLKGDAIPISGRLMAIADVYDALISKRVYKRPAPHTMAVNIIKKNRGTHFDPDMVDAFLDIHEKFRDIARKFADSPEEFQGLTQDTPTEDSTQE